MVQPVGAKSFTEASKSSMEDLRISSTELQVSPEHSIQVRDPSSSATVLRLAPIPLILLVMPKEILSPGLLS